MAVSPRTYIILPDRLPISVAGSLNSGRFYFTIVFSGRFLSSQAGSNLQNLADLLLWNLPVTTIGHLSGTGNKV